MATSQYYLKRRKLKIHRNVLFGTIIDDIRVERLVCTDVSATGEPSIGRIIASIFHHVLVPAHEMRIL